MTSSLKRKVTDEKRVTAVTQINPNTRTTWFNSKEVRKLFYSYGESTKGWKEEKKDELFQKLLDLIKKVNPDNNRFWAKTPWIEKNGHYGSVTIRKIPLHSMARKRLKSKADAIYREVMGLPKD